MSPPGQSNVIHIAPTFGFQHYFDIDAADDARRDDGRASRSDNGRRIASERPMGLSRGERHQERAAAAAYF